MLLKVILSSYTLLLFINASGLDLPDTSVSYSEMKSAILLKRNSLQQSNISIDSAGLILEEILVDKIFLYWYGTPWDFNGYTATPNNGVIACGYFVSTTLLHSGFKLNRYKLAQQAPYYEALSIAAGNEIISFEGESPEAIAQRMKLTLQDGLYFIGFSSSHVGFLMKSNDGIELIHSNYLAAIGVMRESILESEVFKSYSLFYIVPISTNDNLIKLWLSGQEVKVIED